MLASQNSGDIAAKLLHRRAHGCNECRRASAAGKPRLAPSPRALSRHTRPQLSLDTADSAAVRITAPRRPPVASPHAAPREDPRRRCVRASAGVSSKPTASLVRSASSLVGVDSPERKPNNRERIAAICRTITRLSPGRCRSHLTRHKISCGEPSVATTQGNDTMENTRIVDRKLARRQLHRLVRSRVHCSDAI